MISVTQEAILKIKELRPTDDSCIRITCSGGGCSGFQYDMKWTESPEINDKIIIQEDITLFIESRSSLFLKGFVLSYEDGLTSAGFKLSKPDIQFCGCGKSFAP